MRCLRDKRCEKRKLSRGSARIRADQNQDFIRVDLRKSVTKGFELWSNNPAADFFRCRNRRLLLRKLCEKKIDKST